uniref:RING-CH-type domain-containing protein n=1 Tax=Acrobeloides nanus TaxID=290746 RepID=A0A914BZ45_9BILA
MKAIRSFLSTEPTSNNHVNTPEPSTTTTQDLTSKSNRARKPNHARNHSRGSERSQSNLQRGWQMIQKLSFPTNDNLHATAPIEETLYPPPNSEKSSLISYFECDPGSATLNTKGVEPKQCRICHMTTETSKKKIISPCRCTGTMRYVHTSCLAQWLQISASSHFFLPESKCELCGYKYKTRPFYYVFRRIHMPYINNTDFIMHILFFILISIMIFCGAVAFRYLHLSLHRRHPRR